MQEYAKMGIADMRLTPEGIPEFRAEADNATAEYLKNEPEWNKAFEEVEKSEFRVPKIEGHDHEVLVKTYRAPNVPQKGAIPMLLSHGGGAVSGDIHQIGPFAAYYSKKLGVKAFDVDYRLCPEAKNKQQIADYYHAIKYIYNNAEKLGVDKEKIIIQGCSGGAYVLAGVSSMLALKNESGMVKLLIDEQIMCPEYFVMHEKDEMDPYYAICKYDQIGYANMAAEDVQKQIQGKDPVMFPSIAEDAVLKKWPPTVLVMSEYDCMNLSMGPFS